MLNSPYRTDITVDTAAIKYSATVSLVDGVGDAQTTAILSGLAFITGNRQNGNLLFISKLPPETRPRVDKPTLPPCRNRETILCYWLRARLPHYAQGAGSTADHFSEFTPAAP